MTDPESGDLNQGMCRRHPPTVIAHATPQGVSIGGTYPPILLNSGWCGEHQFKAEVAAPTFDFDSKKESP
jgi:hypothetical protein